MSDRCRCGQPKNSTHMCDYKDLQIANFKEALSASQAREKELRGKLKAAEARIKASQEQKPHHWLLKPSASNTHVSLSRRELSLNGNFNEHWQIEAGYYAQPPIPPELAELQRENAELHKLLESKVLEETLIEIVTQAHMAGQFNQSQRDPSYYEARVYYGEKQLSIRAMLAAAPQPKEPKQ